MSDRGDITSNAKAVSKGEHDVKDRPAGGHNQDIRVFRMFRAVRDTGAFHLDDPTFSTNPVRARFPWKKE